MCSSKNWEESVKALLIRYLLPICAMYTLCSATYNTIRIQFYFLNKHKINNTEIKSRGTPHKKLYN